MRIGIDIDDTICCSIENILPHICKYYNLDYEVEKNKSLSYEYYHGLDNYLDFAKKHYDKLIVGIEEKGAVCKDENIDIFIDDNLRNCASVEKENIDVWLFDNCFNRDDNHFDRVYNWENIYNRIVNM